MLFWWQSSEYKVHCYFCPLLFQELEIRALKRRPHWLLVWRKYTIVSVNFDNKQNVSQVDVNDTSKFPNLTFSRVKSYTGSSEFPLI